MGYIGLSFGKFGMAKVNSCEGFQARLLETCWVNEIPLYGIKVLNSFAREIRSRDPRYNEELHVLQKRDINLNICIYVHVYYT